MSLRRDLAHCRPAAEEFLLLTRAAYAGAFELYLKVFRPEEGLPL